MARKPRRKEHIRVGERVTIYRSGRRGIFSADFYYQGHRTQSLRTTNKAAAISKAKLIDAELINGKFSLKTKAIQQPTNDQKVQAIVKQFIEYHRAEGNRHRTVRRYEGILNEFCNFAESRRSYYLQAIDLVLIDAYRVERKKVLQPRSMHNEARLIKCFLAWCEDRNLIPRNPLHKRKFRLPKPTIRTAPSLIQVNQLLKQASALRMPQFAMMAFTGMRAGDCRHLRVEDVDFASGWIHVRSRPGFWTKTGEERKVPMHPRLRLILEELRERPDGWFFRALPSRRYPNGDHHLNTKRLNEDFQAIFKKLDTPVDLRNNGFVLHSLRRFFRTAAVNSGVPERVIGLWLGHRDSYSMGSIYYHLTDEESQRFMQMVNFADGSQDSTAG